MLRGLGAYKKESREKSHHKDRGQSSSKPTYEKKVSNTVSKELKASGACFTCGKKGHLSRNCPDKKDEGKGKAVKKESTSNRAEAETSADEVYINSMEIETYASSGKTAPSTTKAKKALEGTIKINGHDARVLFNTGTIGEDILRAAFVTTHGGETKALEGELRILMAMKGSQSTSSKQSVVDIEVGKMRTRNNRMIVGNLAKYDALIGMKFLSRNQATIECGNSTILFPKHKVKVNCTPTSGLVRAAAIATTEEVMEMFPEVFPDPIPERLPPLREYNHRIQLKDKENLKTQPTFGVPEKYELKLKEWLAQKEREGVIYRKEVPGAAPLFVQGKTDGRIRPLVDLTARNDNTRKDDTQIPNQRTILNALGRSRYRSKIDLSDAYFQTRVEPEYEYLNCFKTPFGGFVSKVMLQGDMNAPGTVMRIMSHLMRDYLGEFVWVYIDDILIFSNKEDEHMEHIKKVCRKLKEAHLFASRKKSEFFSSKMSVLGHVVDDDGLHASPEKITRIGEWTTPKDRKELREFLGLVNYISQFLPHIATITAPLTDLTGNAEFVWTPTHDTAFQNTKRLADDNEVIRPSNHESGVPIWLITDASDTEV